MSRRRKPTTQRSGSGNRPQDSQAQRPSRLRRRALAGLGVLVLIAIAVTIYLLLAPSPRPPTAPETVTTAAAPQPTFVGSKACGTCHVSEFTEWMGSNHQLAMQPATAASVLGDFSDTAFSADGVTSKFFRDGERFMVRTIGADGQVHDYDIGYSFGVYPLQQYLIALPGGRLQAFTVAWDSRPQGAGGQRWFALYPGSMGDPSNPLHWTALDQNWNYMCADCHSTDLRKHYEAKTDSYATTWSEISVGCEACHGPGSAHVAWAEHPDAWPELADSRGLTLALDDAPGISWHTDPANGLVQRSAPLENHNEIRTCARCHASRLQIHQDFVHGQPLGDDYRLALLDSQSYFPDGQIKGEVYEYGSFIQSRMYHAGVTCTNCHNPHSATLRAEGNRLCTSCHLPEKYDRPKHTHHPVGNAGAQCVACHMPTRTYMQIDIRHDHSLRIPRPDLSVALGTPNACNACHRDETPQWAAEHIADWFGPERIGFQHFGRALHAGRLGAPDANRLLARVIADREQPAIARATALRLMARLLDRKQATVQLRAGADDASPLVRRAAVETIPVAGIGKTSLPAIAKLLDDPVRAVRISAADVLAGVNRNRLPSAIATALAAAAAEYVAARELNADRPEAHLNLASFYARQGQVNQAKNQLETALALDPSFAPAATNLADLYRSQGRDDKAATVLQTALQHAPENPALHFALGLLQVRQGKSSQALTSLAVAARGAPANARFSYVYAVALNEAGESGKAIAVLEGSLKYNPYDRPSLEALVNFCIRAGEQAKAAQYRKRLNELNTRSTGP